MLHRLTIRDFVLVDRLELEFKAGFGTLTGETGAGKSILVDALAFALGERSDTNLIRVGRERAEVSVEFDLRGSPAVADGLRELDIETDDGLLIRRVVDGSGRSRAYLNGSPITAQQLRDVGESLVDIYGQHEHQSLLRGDAQRNLLDTHAQLIPLQKEVSEAWRLWREARSMFDTAAGSVEDLQREREQLDWQVREVETLGFSLTEWEALNIEHKRLAHAASLVEGARFSLDLLAEGEGACEGQFDSAARRLDGLAAYDPGLAEVVDLLKSAQAELNEAISALRRYSDRVELDPQRLLEIERRIDAVLVCARKFRTSPEGLTTLLARWQERLTAVSASSDLTALESRVNAARAHYEEVAGRLTKSRAGAAQALGVEVSRVMQQLALGGGRFEVALVPVTGGSAHGLEQVEFRIAGLSGSETRALAKAASGGELSRISLAIQVVTSQARNVPTLLFDEVDVGIGGGVAEVVGRLLSELGAKRQVLCVTHLPQVAARANWQWQVSKHSHGDQVCSRVLALDDEARIEELARMLGGVEITAITRQHAREMLCLTG
ncbi:MAG: DNA repair protein RecN [Propionivibrio sp.]|nr:DNA repair protein RecN [Propionivibrio sp.]